MRSAMIAIVDDTEHTTRGTASPESALKRSSERLGAEQKRRFDHHSHRLRKPERSE
jgi:hypothetical protein